MVDAMLIAGPRPDGRNFARRPVTATSMMPEEIGERQPLADTVSACPQLGRRIDKRMIFTTPRWCTASAELSDATRFSAIMRVMASRGWQRPRSILCRYMSQP
jgi:hypothetical protein